MDFVTYLQATEITGKNKRTIQRSVSNGKLSYATQIVDGKEVKLFNKAELIALHGQVSPVSPIPAPLTSVTHEALADYETIAEIISKAIVEAQQPLLDRISALTAQVEDLTHRLDKPKPEPEKVPERVIEKPDFLKEETKGSTSYLDDIPTFGSR
jgi:hypothetical protein